MEYTVRHLLAALRDDDGVGVKFQGRQWSWREHLHDAAVRAAALQTLLDTGRPPHVGVLLSNGPEMLAQMAAAGLGGHVICGVNNTRRGDALAADIRRSDCQVVVTDAEHGELLDGLDLAGVRVVDSRAASGPNSSTAHRN